MQQEDQALARDCRTLAENAGRALQWLEDNRATVGNEYAALHLELRRAGRMFGQCETAALRKMCVGVFGPSQSGKSYLISALASDKYGTFITDFAGQQYNFIKDINPIGGKESTGLVTRFTTTPPPNLPPDFPIRLRLLSETDVVRVLANTYYADCEHKEMPDQDALLAALDKLEARRAAAPVPGAVTRDDVDDLREYLYSNFAARPRIQLLHKVYWQRAAELAPCLETSDRGALFGLIWDDVENFTSLYRALCDALQQLGNAAEVHCAIDALIPRESSIIDVALLKNLGQTGGERLTLSGVGGRTASLPRSLVTALTAEITIYMPEKPDDFFDHTDLLDFPGYRSRLKLTDLRRELERDGMLENLFLRGKVAYLFERYCADRELTSMLLCIGPGNQEVQDLPHAVQQWIAATHGETPARRAGVTPALFFVLSKMDMEFEKKQGTPSVELRWTTRLQASLLDFFGKNDDWPTNWDGVHAFNNVFLLRNPNIHCEAIFTFEDDREFGVRPEQAGYVHEVRDAFLHSPLVQTHVGDPVQVWDAAMSLNDGGVGLLREKLRPVCQPILKRQQIAGTLSQWLDRLTAALNPHWKTDDKEEERHRKAMLAQQLARIMATMVSNQLFGEFLGSLQVRDHDLYALYFRAEQQRLQEDSAPATAVGAHISADDILGDLFGVVETSMDAVPSNLKDEAGHFVDLVIDQWMDQLRRLAASPAFQLRYGFPEKTLGLFVHELSTAFSRLAVPEHMTAALRQASSYGNTVREMQVWKQVSLAADVINAFVDWLGFDPRSQDAAARTVVIQGRPATLFTPPSAFRGPMVVSEEPSPYDRVWSTDWLRALLHTIEANVDFDGGVVFDREQNNRLHAILTAFQTPVIT